MPKETEEVSVVEVIRKDDRVAISLAIRGESDWLHCPVFARIEGNRLVEWTTVPMECFIAPPRVTESRQNIRPQ